MQNDEKLLLVLDQLLPASLDGKMPGLAEVGFLDYIIEEGHISWIREGLQSSLPPFLRRLSTLVLQFYYQQDRVLKALGLEARPPFPEGYHIEEGDFTLLEQVYERGKIYRDTGGTHAFEK